MQPAGRAEADRGAGVAWFAASLFYFYQYVMRSAPAVMVPELSHAFGLSAGGLTALLGLFYYGYAPFSLVAGLAMDRIGPRRVAPVAALLAGLGCLAFVSGDVRLAAAGALLQGAAGAFALVAAAYIATGYFPASRVATLVGATQMFGMAGASAGQFLVAPAMTRGLGWSVVWLVLALAALPLAVFLFMATPPGAAAGRGGLGEALRGIIAVLRNPQSILCGVIAGLLFLPTTVFSLVWGVRFLQEAHDLPYMVAVLRSASVPVGWILGAPLLGALSDRLGRRKPVIAASGVLLLVSLALILYGPPGLAPPYTLGLLAGFASGGAMIPYIVIKEANQPELKGTATGVLSFLNFSLSAVLGPIFGAQLVAASGGASRELGHYQQAFLPLVFAVALAVGLTALLRETGTARRRVAPGSASVLRS
jgi:MFS family permease